jgi:hypothetical protein
MISGVNGILALSYAWKVSLALIVTFFVIMPLLAHGLLGFAGVVAKGEQAANDEYEENVTAPK